MSRVEVADRILTAAGELFVRDGVDGPGMGEVARSAGCSRATLYRHFTDRQALLDAFARREAAAIGAEVAARTAGLHGRARLVEGVLATLAAVRAREHLTAWYAHGTDTLHRVLGEEVLAAFGQTPADADRGAWVLRVVLSFLTLPEDDAARERLLIEKFLLPGG